VSRTSLEADQQPRTLLVAGKLDEPQRISRADEAVITKRVHDAEDEALNRARGDVAGNLARLEGELRTELLRLRDPRVRTTRQSYRDLGGALTLIGKVRRTLAPNS
jgi:hypothetical protein